MKKDDIICTLWIAYSLGFASLTTTLEGREPVVEKLFLGLLFGQIILAVYLLIVMCFNATLRCLKFRIKLPPPQRFLVKITPIYEVNVYEEVDNYFEISKYELAWVDFNSFDYRFFLLPFCTLFKRYKYYEVGSYSFERELKEDTSIELLFEEKFAEKSKKQREEETAKQKELNKINKLNKVFKENYER
jgi:hypothetical protein